MDIYTLRSALASEPFGHTIHYHSSVPSTMPLAHTLAQEAVAPADASGVVVVTDEQTAGRGRLDRRWETPPGRALLVSVVVAGSHLPARPAQLPMIAGLAVLEAVHKSPTPDRCAEYKNGTCESVTSAHLSGVGDFDFRLKWPNDLVARLPDGPEKSPVKVAGLLAESRLDRQGIRYAVLGIGVNVNQRPDEFSTPRVGGLLPASLFTLTGSELSRDQLLIALCRSLSGLLAGPNRPTAEEVHARWEAALINLGQEAVVHAGGIEDTQWRGLVVGTEIDGALLIEDVLGRRVSVSAGDVSVAMVK